MHLLFQRDLSKMARSLVISTETIVQLIVKSKRNKFIDKLIDALFQIQGG